MTKPTIASWAGLRATLALALSLAVAGCGGGPGVAVSGNVLFEGNPVEDGMIQFIPSAGTEGPTAGGPIRDGKYDISASAGPVPGEYRVEVSSYKEMKEATDKELAGALFGRPSSGTGTEPQVIRKNAIPPRFNATSELKATIPPGSSYEANFDLK